MASATVDEPGPLHDQTAFRRDLLAVVHTMPGAKGLAIMAEMEELWEQDINHGRLYPNLTDLADQGLIEKGKADDRTNTYELTSRGERELAHHLAWLNEAAGDLLD